MDYNEKKQMIDYDLAKLDANYTIRIPQKLKNYLDKFCPERTGKLNTKLRNIIAREAHAANFDPRIYLGQD